MWRDRTTGRGTMIRCGAGSSVRIHRDSEQVTRTTTRTRWLILSHSMTPWACGNTAGFGFQLSGGAGAGGSFSAALVVDGQGQVGLAVTGGAGGAGGMGGSLVVQGQGSNANTIQQLRGPGGSVSVSAGEGVVGQGEVFVGDGYIGGAGGIGIGGGLPVSVNGELTYTKVWCIFNCRDNRSVRPGTDNGPQTSSRLATPGPCNRAGTLGGRKQ